MPRKSSCSFMAEKSKKIFWGKDGDAALWKVFYITEPRVDCAHRQTFHPQISQISADSFEGCSFDE